MCAPPHQGRPFAVEATAESLFGRRARAEGVGGVLHRGGRRVRAGLKGRRRHLLAEHAPHGLRAKHTKVKWEAQSEE